MFLVHISKSRVITNCTIRVLTGVDHTISFIMDTPCSQSFQPSIIVSL